jgi:fatty-acyl-CoA synthase
MRGLMQETPLVVNDILDYAAKFHANQEVVSRMTEGNIVTVTYRELHVRAQQCALALKQLGVR